MYNPVGTHQLSAFTARAMIRIPGLVLEPPADPMAVAGPSTLVASQLVNATHATNAWAAVMDLHFGR